MSRTQRPEGSRVALKFLQLGTKASGCAATFLRRSSASPGATTFHTRGGRSSGLRQSRYEFLSVVPLFPASRALVVNRKCRISLLRPALRASFGAGGGPIRPADLNLIELSS